jgi:flagellar biosynthesis protein FlhB
VKSKVVKPKAVKIQPIITNKPKPRYKMNKNELRAEYKDITGSSPGKMTVKQMQEAIKRYTFKSP